MWWIPMASFVLATAGFLAIRGARVAARRSQRLLGRMKTTAIAALKPDERAKITGVVAARDELLTAPISGQPCIAFQVVIEGREPFLVFSGAPPVTSEGLHEWVRREACGAFTLTDDTGTAVIEGPCLLALEPDDAAYTDLPPSVFALLQDEVGPTKASKYARGSAMRFREAVLKPGDRVSVLGRARMELDPAGRGSYREAPMLNHITGTTKEPVTIIDVEEDPAGAG
jgi:hypothetical protein